MVIQYQSKKSDVISFYGYYYFVKRIRLVSFAWMLFGGLISGFCDKDFSVSEFIGRFLFGAFITYIILFIIPFLKATWRLSRLKFPNDAKISVVERGIIIESNNNYRLIKWLDILNAGRGNRNIFIIYDNNQFVIIPKRAFSSIDEIEFFLTTTKSKIVKNKVIYFNQSSGGSHLYKRGWWGLVPLIGGFVGLALLILGVFEYKDKKLIGIGVAGILFNILIYSAVIYQTEYSISGGEALAQTDRWMLNKLVKDIEFYKIENGIYPDNLNQLLKQDSSAWVEDPLENRGFGQRQSKMFNYKKIGDKYTLFSSGIDQIVNTDDDIYPAISDSGSAKTGLIIQ